jgi:hypothetical protein
MRSACLQSWLSQLTAGVALLASTASFTGFCAEPGKPPAGASGKLIQPALGAADGILGIILPALLCALGLVLIWVLQRCEASARRRRFAQGGEVYIKSKCRDCGGPIEFPAHGLGEWVECPHCSFTIELRKLGLMYRLRCWFGSLWSRRASFGWKWAAVLIAMMVCGTALLIYTDLKSQSAERARIESTRNFWLEQQAEEMARANEIALDAAAQRPLQAFDEALQRSNEEYDRNQQLREMRRANDIADRAAFAQRMEAIGRDSAAHQAGIDQLMQASRQELREIYAPKPPKRWISHYNSLTRQWEWTASDY